VGTLVWDTIHGPDGGPPVEDWGGIAYSLAAWDAVAPDGWTLVPILRVGEDLRESADRFLAGLEAPLSLEHVRSVPEANNRVSLFYHDRSRRCEKLTGGVSGWPAGEIQAAALSCDALYVNFISGWEIDRAGAAGLARRFEGLAWCDVHSLILGVRTDGVREPRFLEDRERWLGAFDFVQVNEDELAILGRGDTRQEKIADLLTDGPEAVFLTLGPDGAAWGIRPGLSHGEGHGTLPVEDPVEEADPTGCGDVWGITCFAALLEGAGVVEAVRRANRLAAITASGHGTRGLAGRLSGAAAAENVER
jgi:sugar/nucleoside kinase (ribokinase family)